MDESWQTFPLDERFSISDRGRVRGRRVILKLQRDKDGYAYFLAWSGGRSSKTCKLYKVHRAVVMTFVGAIPDGDVINHLNGVKDDNRLENLEICSASANTLHSFRTLGRVAHKIRAKGEQHGNSKHTEADVLEMRRLYAAGMRQIDIAAKFHTTQACVSGIVRRVSWPHV